MSHTTKSCASASERLLAVLTDHVATLESCGFGSESPINGADAVDAVNDHFEQLRDALAAARAEIAATRLDQEPSAATIDDSTMRPMTIEEFRATGRDADLAELDMEGPGRIYEAGLHIQRWESRSTWLLVIMNAEWEGELADLEQHLYAFGIGEGVLLTKITESESSKV